MNKFIRIGYAIYNIENIISVYKIECNSRRNLRGIRIELKNDTQYMYYKTKKDRDNAFETISCKLINEN